MNKLTDQQIEIAQTIMNQLGGKRFVAMTGAKDHTALDSGVQFKIGRNATPCNTVSIEYDAGRDLYNMTFEKVSLSKKTWDVTRKTIKHIEGVFCDQLAGIFTEVTGLDTRL